MFENHVMQSIRNETFNPGMNMFSRTESINETILEPIVMTRPSLGVGLTLDTKAIL